MEMPISRPCAFLDRDGVLIEDTGYPHRIEDVRWIPGIMPALRRLNAAGLAVCIVTNQAGVARGKYDESTVARMHVWMAGQARAAGARIDGFAYCPFHEQAEDERYRRASPRRKPGGGMIEDWLAKATEHPGSWWPDWASWLASHAGKQIAAPRAPGRGQYKATEPAPGRYVKAKA